MQTRHEPMHGASFNSLQAIRPCPRNPFYWEYNGNPVLLLGGSWQDNLFNHPEGLAEHLDRLSSLGGNYIRNTMSHRDFPNVFAYERVGDRFDLDRPNEEYWSRLENLLQLACDRDIIVQIEVWETWDFFVDHMTKGGWSKHPYNPANNRNYSHETSKLPAEIAFSPNEKPSGHPFFRTVPELDGNHLVLGYQQAFVNRMLSHTLRYPNVLYCMNNETGEPIEWSEYWIRYIRETARLSGRVIHTTDMRRNNDITAEDHMPVYRDSSLYSFVDISQNNSQSIGLGEIHWERIMKVREILQELGPRPMNNTKIYSREEGVHVQAAQRFWRTIFGGCASARFHRPHPCEGKGGSAEHESKSFHGLGLHAEAQANIRSLRMLTGHLDLVHCSPSNNLLRDRARNAAYCLADRYHTHALYFPDGGSVTLDLSAVPPKMLRLDWLRIPDSKWVKPVEISGGRPVHLRVPGEGPWAALVRVKP